MIWRGPCILSEGDVIGLIEILSLDEVFIVTVDFATVLSNCMSLDKHSARLGVDEHHKVLEGLAVDYSVGKVAIGDEVTYCCFESLGVELFL